VNLFRDCLGNGLHLLFSFEFWLMHFQSWQTFIQWVNRIGCAILFPQDLHRHNKYMVWAKKCGAITYQLVDMDVEEVVKTPVFITPIGCVFFEIPMIPSEKLVPYLRSPESHDLRAKVKFLIERAKTLARIACRQYGGCTPAGQRGSRRRKKESGLV